MEDEAASRAYIEQMWAEAMEIYRSGRFKLAFSPAMQRYLKEHQRDFMPEDTKAGMIQAYLDKYTGNMVCSKQLYKEALNHAFDEPKQWEMREINEIMNLCIDGWRYFPSPRMFSEYGRQKGWEGENPATDSDNPSEKTMDSFVEITEQMGARIVKAMEDALAAEGTPAEYKEVFQAWIENMYDADKTKERCV